MPNLKTIIDMIKSSKENDLILIEAFGMPGSGKSYLTGKVHKENEEYFCLHTIDFYQQSRILRVIYKMYIIFFELTLQPDLYRSAGNLLSNFNSLNFKNKMKLMFNFLYLISIIKRKFRSKKILILDQGIFQGLWSCHFYNNGITANKDDILSTINKIISKLGVDKMLVINIITDEKKITSRIKNRTMKGNTKLNINKAESLEKGFMANNFVCKYLKKLNITSDSIKIIDIQN